MKIPFLHYFIKATPERQTSSFILPKTVAKPDGDRLSKTVMPNVTRTVAVEEPRMESRLQCIAPMAGPRRFSLGPDKETMADKKLPPAVAVALAPRVERAISFDVASIVKHLPPGLAKPLESIDGTRRILLKAEELERGMAQGRPNVSLGNLYVQAPEIFLKEVAPSDETLIDLPVDEVMEAFMQVQVRRDQLPDQTVAQVETPFLQVTLEDNERFGLPTTPAPVLAELPPMRLELATAESFAAAQPESASDFVAGPAPTQISPDAPVRISLEENEAETKKQAAAPGRTAPERIPFHLPPKETGAPASERVPASCGPPVSTPRQAPPPPVRHYVFTGRFAISRRVLPLPPKPRPQRRRSRSVSRQSCRICPSFN